MFLLFATSVINAQISCTNESVLWLENFGAGTTATSGTDVVSLIYQETGSLANEGTYRIINTTNQKPEWHASEDFTLDDVNGKMLVINGEAEPFYRRVANNAAGFAEGTYIASLYLMNVNTPGTCAPTPLVPVVSYNVEYLDATNNWVALGGSPYTASAVVQSATPTWVSIAASFVLPSTVFPAPTQLRLIIADGTVGGCGNDFAVDDIKFSLCPQGGPTPVTFLNINARQKGSGVSIDWSTSQEINSNYFEIQKSPDGNSNWNVVASVNGSGNSQVIKNYNAYDAKPLSGINYYRIKQVDKDGDFKFSKTVNVKLDLVKTGVSILANPFHSSLTVDFASVTDQIVFARLLDISGKQVAIEKWSVASGNTRKEFSNVGGLQRGMYMLSIVNNAGEVLFNSKVIKQ